MVALGGSDLEPPPDPHSLLVRRNHGLALRFRIGSDMVFVARGGHAEIVDKLASIEVIRHAEMVDWFGGFVDCRKLLRTRPILEAADSERHRLTGLPTASTSKFSTLG